MFKSIKRDEDLSVPKEKKPEKGIIIRKNVATCLKGIDHRFSCHISTDKHQYKPEETVHIRGILLNEFSHMPAMKRFIGEPFNFRILGPSGAVVYGGEKVATPAHQKSVVAYDWKIPENIPGGSYKIEIGKQFYDKGEMQQDEQLGQNEEKDLSGEDEEFDLYPGSSAFCSIEGSSVTRIGRNGWHCLVRKKMTKNVQKFKVKIEQSASDKSGIFIGVVGKNTRKNDIWKCCSLNHATGGNPQVGSEYEFEVDQVKKTMKVWMNGIYQATTSEKLGQFSKPWYFGVFMHYKNNKVTFIGESKGGFFPVATRAFDIMKYTPPKFKMDLKFTKKGYGPGSLVQAVLTVERREGGVPPSCQVEASSRVDGKEVFRQKYTCNSGTQFIQYKLPDQILEGNGSLNCSVTEGVTENISKTLPILLKKIDCKIYPEGGDLVLGLPNGVYLEAKTLYGSPAHFEGFLIEKDLLNPMNARPICEVKVVHEGRGSFQFTPLPNKTYHIQVLKPEGITVPIEIPNAKPVGMTIRLIRRRSVEAGQMIEVGLAATRTIETKLVLCKKDKVVDMTSEAITIPQGGPEKIITLNPKDVDGVLRLTSFFISPDFGVTDLIYPVAERLIMVKPRRILELEIQTKKRIYTPGEKVSIRVIPKIEGSLAPPSIVCCTVTDDSVVSMLEKRKRAPRLLEQVYLENEVKELKDCTAYIHKEDDNDNIEPDVACDLLLGTQGWRRFIYVIQQKNPKFFEEEKYKNVISEKEFFYRMLNLPNPEYFTRKKKSGMKIIEEDFEEEEGEGEEYHSDSSSDEEASYVDDESEEEEEEERMMIPRRAFRSVAKSAEREKGGRPAPKPKRAPKRAVNVVPQSSMKQTKAVVFDSIARSSSSSKGKKKMKKESSKRERRRREDNEKKKDEEEMKDMEEDGISVSSLLMPSIIEEEQSMDFYGDVIDIEDDEFYPSPLRIRSGKDKIMLKSVTYAREFAFSPRPNKPQGVRDEFEETVLFSPFRETYLDQGTQQQICDFDFHVSDSITSFVVRIDAFTMDGIVGSSNQFKITAQKPFFVTPKLPIEISMADEVSVPVGIINNLPMSSKCSVGWEAAKNSQLIFRNPQWNGTINSQERKVEYFDLKVQGAYVSGKNKKQSVTCRGVLPDYAISDEVTKTISVQPYGFLTCLPFSGVLQKDETLVLPFQIDPKTLVPGSLETIGSVTPSSLGSFMTAVKGLIREPYGCFEQVAATLYPMIMAKQFLLDQQTAPLDPKIERFLKKGYDKLIGYEISGGGFDWYGNAPANESLSALGLAQFIELEKVFSIDPNVIERTKNWLLSRKTNEGFLKGRGRYAYGHASQGSTDAYILWCLSRTKLVGFEEIESVIKNVHQKFLTGQNRKNDNYVTALLSLCYFNFGKFEESSALARLLVPEQKGDGSLTESVDTITRSGGRNKHLEITALSCLSWMNLGAAYQEQIIKAIDFILKNNKAGCYGSTQSTVLCLNVIIKYFGGRQDSEGYIEVEVNGKSKWQLDIPKYQNKQVEFGDFGKDIKVDGTENQIMIRNHYGNTLPYSVALWYKVTIPPIEQETLPFRFSTSVSSQRIKEGDVTEINVELSNHHQVSGKDEDIPMIVAIVSVPSGLTPRMERLKELQKMGVYDYFELFGARNVVFYWRGMAPKEVKKFAFEVSASIPGKYIGDASRAYLYYDNDIKFYVRGLEIQIDTK